MNETSAIIVFFHMCTGMYERITQPVIETHDASSVETLTITVSIAIQVPGLAKNALGHSALPIIFFCLQPQAVGLRENDIWA